jgi:hypothetical protein
MKKNLLKYSIDVFLFIDICSIAVIGFLLGFVIPRGREARVSNYFLGLHRHEWADLHLTLSVVLLVLLILHLWLNWAWIVLFSKRYFGSRWQKALWTICGAWVLVLFIGWIVL